MAEAEMNDPAEADQLAFQETLERGFERAAAGSGIVVRDFRVAGFRLRLRFAGPALVPAIVPAIAHLETPTGPSPDFTIDLFDAESTASPLPFLAARFVDLLRLRWWEHLHGRREIKGLNGERIRSVFHLGPDILVTWDRHRDRGLYWVERASSIPYYEKGYPLSVLLNWWLASRGCHVVHAACIGVPDAGLLLTGRGGSGKSTTTLACVEAGLRIAGDDYVAIDVVASTAHSLYNTVKLKTLADVARFPGLESRVSNLDPVGDDDREGDGLPPRTRARLPRGFDAAAGHPGSPHRRPARYRDPARTCQPRLQGAGAEHGLPVAGQRPRRLPGARRDDPTHAGLRDPSRQRHRLDPGRDRDLSLAGLGGPAWTLRSPRGDSRDPS